MRSNGLERRIRVAILLPTLEMGGAERQAIELANRLDRTRFDVTLIAFRQGGDLAGLLQNVPLEVIRSQSAMSAFFELLRIAKNFDIAQSFLLKTNVFLLFVKLLVPRLKVVLGLRDTMQDRSKFYGSVALRLKVGLLHKLARLLLPLSSARISNSQAGLKISRGRATVIPNGIDTERFRPDPDAGRRLRQVIGSAEGAPVVGMVANCSVYKDYPNFVRAVSSVIREIPEAQFVSMGENRTSEGRVAAQLTEDLSLESSIHFMGCRRDVEKLIPGMDVFCSSSVTEGFSNAIAEAMACGVPCVVTDVGDSALIVGESGIVVRPGSPKELGAGIVRMLRLTPAERENLQVAARHRIVTNFGMTRMVSHHEDLYRRLLSGREKSSHIGVANTPAV